MSTGVPVDKFCSESAPGVFKRQWSKGTAELNCNTFTATLPE
jgi:hypothetical protein